ncbi:MAG: hypothetical protein J7559_02605, partial [Cohnella sp.]|nr:hypothetical protein [Cohnella sp.]
TRTCWMSSTSTACRSCRRTTSPIRQQEIESINKLSQGVQDALKEKYSAEKKAAEDALKTQLDANDKWRSSSIDNVKAVYDYRIKAAQQAADAEIARLNEVLGAQIKAIQDELDALEAAEKQKSRADLDADDEKKIARLQAKLDYERDEYNKTQLQKEINKVISDQEARHQKEQLDDKKDALKSEQKSLQDKLKEKTDLVKQQLADKKEMLQADRDAEIARIESIAEVTKNSLNATLAATQAHYAKLLSAKALQAEAEKMIVSNQQTEIIKLLEGFGDSYNLTGQTLGEKMYEGFAAKVNQIQTLIASINAQIDAARNAAVAALNSAAAATQPKTGTSGKSVSVVNNFNSPVTSPSDVSKATQKTAQQLALG